MNQTQVVLILLSQQIYDLYDDRILPKAHVYPASLYCFLLTRQRLSPNFRHRVLLGLITAYHVFNE